ncbi:hypothetical protein FACS18942_07510 [Planctomycetales bacterium]|nr:hypothetical protein FACS18942_07510 [Planctomycetales bacterium]
MSAVFRKEFCRHYPLVIVMVALCFLIQIAPLFWFDNAYISYHSIDLAGAALFITMLFAGTAAAISFSAEHDEKTFSFLRRLPLTPQTIALGKGSFVILSTLIVFAATLILTLLFEYYYELLSIEYIYKPLPPVQNTTKSAIWEVFGAAGFGIIDALVWGFFWSPRCRSQIKAVLLTFFCAGFTAWLFANFAGGTESVLAAYSNVIPFRALADVIVAVFAVRGMIKWFDFDRDVVAQGKTGGNVRRNVKSSPLNFPFLPFENSSPFFALLRHSFRQSWAIYLTGIVSVVMLLVLYLGMRFTPQHFRHDGQWMVRLTLPGHILLPVFLGLIFSQDHRNGSYRFLTRCGVSAGTVWQTRMLPVLLIYLPLLVFPFFDAYGPNALFRSEDIATQIKHQRLMIDADITMWLIPLAAASFVSVSCGSIIVSIALTAGLALGILTVNMILWTLFGINYLLTSAAVSIALLLASRIRCAYWIQEQFTWRSRLIPLVPVFAVILISAVAVPLYRIYSVPLVSWEQLNNALQTAGIKEKIPPEQLNALLLSAQKGEPSNRFTTEYYKEFFAANRGFIYAENNFSVMQNDKARYEQGNQFTGTLKEYLREQIRVQQNAADKMLTLQEGMVEYLRHQQNFLRDRKNIFGDRYDYGSGYRKRWKTFSVLFCFWEKYRAERLIRLQVILSLEDTGVLKDPESLRLAQNFPKLQWNRERGMDELILDRSIMLFNRQPAEMIEHTRLRPVYEALFLWYLEHNNTLPENLDVLVKDGLLTKLPVEPAEGKKVEYLKDESKLMLGKTTMRLYFLINPSDVKFVK